MKHIIKSLKESSAPDLSDNTINILIRKALIDMLSIGLKLPTDIQFEILDSTDTLGSCSLGTKADNSNELIQVVFINRYLLKVGLENLLLNTLYHEFCHYLQNLDLVKNVSFNFETHEFNFKDKAEEEYYTANDGHSACWYKYVNQVNSKINPDILITDHPIKEEFDKYINANEDDVKYILKCDTCNNINKRLSYNYTDGEFEVGFLASILYTQTEHIPNHSCGSCRGNIYIEPVEPDALKKIALVEQQKILMQMMLNK